MAYRQADNLRWQSMDFVVGQCMETSHNHTETDICDTLAGDYPKAFLFEGRPPQCFCHVTPILVSERKVKAMLTEGKPYETEQIEAYPEQFENWVRSNETNIERVRETGASPYFIKHNGSIVDGTLGIGSNADD